MQRWLRLALIGLLGSCGYQESEMRCDEAAAHLADCCGSANIAVECEYDFIEVTNRTYGPGLTLSESQCILAMSCASLQTTGVCRRAQSVPQQDLSESCGANSPTPISFNEGCRALVCP